MTDPSSPLPSHVHSSLEHDRLAVHRLGVELCVELLPAVIRDDAPGWQGLARRSFDTRCEQVAADVHRVSSSLHEVSAVLAAAISTMGTTP